MPTANDYAKLKEMPLEDLIGNALDRVGIALRDCQEATVPVTAFERKPRLSKETVQILTRAQELLREAQGRRAHDASTASAPLRLFPERSIAGMGRLRIVPGSEANVDPSLVVIQADLGTGFKNATPRTHAYELLIWVADLTALREADQATIASLALVNKELADALAGCLKDMEGHGYVPPSTAAARAGVEAVEKAVNPEAEKEVEP